MPAKGIGISPYFKKAAAAAVTPSPLIASWYAALSVKPSAALLTALNTLVNGMNTDGDWTELDFLAVVAGMETQEQALLPLKSTSGDIMLNVDLGGGGIVIDNSGATANGTDVINSKWNPNDNGSKWTLNSAFYGVYMQTQTVNTGQIFGSYSTPDDVNFYLSQISITQAAGSVSVTTPSNRPLNGGATAFGSVSKAKAGSNIPVYAGIKRTASNAGIAFINGNSSANNTSTPLGRSATDILLCGVNQTDSLGTDNIIACTTFIQRALLCGSGIVSQANTGARLNTFFVSRSLNPYV